MVNEDIETLNYNFISKKINKYSNIGIKGLYDLKKSINTEYGLSYSYFDECFGISLDFSRKSYTEEELKPQDTLTIMFSFKNIGSYKSSNLAVSENDKQDIKWESNSVKNELFNWNEPAFTPALGISDVGLFGVQRSLTAGKTITSPPLPKIPVCIEASNISFPYEP